ncbi:MAG TPA: Fic family protein [Clostridiales bacterium]|jgi:Fic family protein|nr:Fic family protein [Clostridiales bacterium]HQP69872.1 Fic family protein [Clostridiales bacterium]
MKPPYDITPDILNLIASVSEKLGEVNAVHLDKPSPQLRRENRIKTVQSSLAIEGNALTIDQVTAIYDDKKVAGPKKDILEVKNAIELYNRIGEFDPFSSASFLKAHNVLMKGLINDPGNFRSGSVGVIKGSEVMHVAPPGDRVRYLVNDLFKYLKSDRDAVLIKSCVFHYETEFIHPFMDGNGRMGRFWQTVILRSKYPVFEYLPVESIIKEKQQKYYEILSACDKTGKSTMFIEFMLKIIDSELNRILWNELKVMNSGERLDIAKEKFGMKEFSRKDYLRLFKDISTATASRDLKSGTESGLLLKKGDKNMTVYLFA